MITVGDFNLAYTLVDIWRMKCFFVDLRISKTNLKRLHLGGIDDLQIVAFVILVLRFKQFHTCDASQLVHSDDISF